jgi:serine/threonine-protein kinase HipA
MATDTLRLDVSTPQGPAGVLAREEAYRFAYSPHAPAEVAVSLTMPPRLQPYDSANLHPIFQMNLPEGYLLERLRNRLAKTTGMEPMLLLALLGGDAAIGRIRFAGATAAPKQAGESLSAILAYRGAEGLFDSLVDRYLMRSALSGVQPKLLVPEAPEAGHKAAALTSELIIKSGLAEFPGLAINEFLCMSIARAAGLPGPEFYLSDDRQLFVMRRFDRDEQGRPLGFEDMAVLTGKDAAAKYQGSYEAIARVIGLYCPPEQVGPALARLFEMVALSCIVQNGDAHLKNFGLLYRSAADATLAPAYDIVNTTAYIPEDSLALTLGGSKSFSATRQTLLEFAGRCQLRPAQAKARLIELAQTAIEVLRQHQDLANEVPAVANAIRQEAQRYLQTFERHAP